MPDNVTADGVSWRGRWGGMERKSYATHIEPPPLIQPPPPPNPS